MTSKFASMGPQSQPDRRCRRDPRGDLAAHRYDVVRPTSPQPQRAVSLKPTTAATAETYQLSSYCATAREKLVTFRARATASTSLRSPGRRSPWCATAPAHAQHWVYALPAHQRLLKITKRRQSGQPRRSSANALQTSRFFKAGFAAPGASDASRYTTKITTL